MISPSKDDTLLKGREASWCDFAATMVATLCLAMIALTALIVTTDPFGLRVGRGTKPRPLMDINQRYMYPQLARSGLFDSAVFGTSTLRLLDPTALDARLGGRFANLGLNAGTPWEQMQLAELFLRHVPHPKELVFGLDRTWCEADADRKRLTFRSFPPWLYDGASPGDIVHLVDLKTLEIAGRVALNALGLMPARIRADGFEVFTPPEDTYDLARARFHIYGHEETGLALSDAPGDPNAPFPALGWLRDLLRRVDPETRIWLVLPPVHIVSQAAPGSAAEARDRACKAALTDIAAERSAIVVDFRWPSRLTSADENYWDKLHYRRPVADTIIQALADAASGRTGGPAWSRLR